MIHRSHAHTKLIQRIQAKCKAPLHNKLEQMMRSLDKSPSLPYSYNYTSQRNVCPDTMWSLISRHDC
jgi:hypothetical protein